jgi:hypothetical protein
MPEYVLPLDSVESHQWLDGLPEIARGYVEAAFFCGVDHWDPETGEPVEIESPGPAMLDADGRETLEADALRFWLENAGTLETATAGGAYDLAQAGRDFWFSRNGHGVGFFDRDALDPETRDALQTAAEGFGECDLFADPADGDGWRVTVAFSADPLREIERAAVRALEAGTPAETVARIVRGASALPPAWIIERGEAEQYRQNARSAAREALEALAGDYPPADPLPVVGGRFGAPMGRRGWRLDDGEPVAVYPVALDQGGYDSGGAYWGLGAPLWRVIGRRSGAVRYVRGRNRADAIREAMADALQGESA